MLDTILAQSGLTVYLSLFALLIAGALGMPVPEDVPLILGGMAAQSERAEIEIVLAVCYVATLLGDLIIFGSARKFGPAILNKPWMLAKISAERLEETKRGLEKRSLIMIFLARHLFYLRTATFLTCGAVKMNPWRFILSDAVAALVSVPLMVGLGYIFAENHDALFAWLSKVKEGALILGVLVLLGYLLYRARK